MSEVIPELKQVLGAMIFAAGKPVTLTEMKKTLIETAQLEGGAAKAFESVKESNIRDALAELVKEMNEDRKLGFHLVEIAGGYRIQSDSVCGKWVKHLLDIGKPSRLSRPSLETLAIIAYRQPISKAQIEGVRGVNIDHIIKTLLEMRLIKIAGRSELPGRPFLYATTQTFLEHFGLKDIKDLKDIEPMLLIEKENEKNQKKEAQEPALEVEQMELGQKKPLNDQAEKKKAKPEEVEDDELSEDEEEDEFDDDDEDDEEDDDEQEDELDDEDEKA